MGPIPASVRTRFRVLLVTLLLANAACFTAVSNQHASSSELIFSRMDGIFAIYSKRTRTTALNATPGANPRSGSTARESAVIVEWEPVSELQRRIDEGVNYEHWVDNYNVQTTSNGRPGRRPRRQGSQTVNAAGQQTATLPTVKGVFCGYRCTNEERGRLKSADPDVSDFSI
jgi:hypothetical protein